MMALVDAASRLEQLTDDWCVFMDLGVHYSHMSQELLIELVKDRPCLYDKQHKGYHDSRGVRADSWDEIVKGMDEGGYGHIIPSTTVAMDKWTNIRDGFVRAKRKFETQYSDGDAPLTAPTYIYWKNLQWLLPYYHCKSDPNSSAASALLEATANQHTPAVAPARKRKKLQSPLNFDSQINSFNSALTRMINVKDGDEHDIFGKMVAHEIRKITDEARLLDAKLDILSAIKRARYPPSRPDHHCTEQTISLAELSEHSN